MGMHQVGVNHHQLQVAGDVTGVNFHVATVGLSTGAIPSVQSVNNGTGAEAHQQWLPQIMETKGSPYQVQSFGVGRTDIQVPQQGHGQQAQGRIRRPFLEQLATTVDACMLFRKPGRESRPALIAIILRGLPGSGKSMIAQAMRDAEVEAGAPAPKIHSLDDYFMTEVEHVEVEDEEQPNGRVLKRRKKIMKTQYVYEAEMESTYKASLLKGLQRTAEERRFNCVIGTLLV